MTLPIWLVDAFTDCALQGNPAGVVPDANSLSPTQMQRIAAEIHASETAFVLAPESPAEADFRLRFFTPESEVDLCGHATIGTICGLVDAGRLPLRGEQSVCRIETAVGILSVTYGKSHGLTWAEMRQAEPQFRQVDLELQTIAKFLGIDRQDVDDSLISGISYTGLWDLFIPVTSLAVMAKMNPDLTALAKLNRALGVASTHVYTRATVSTENDFHARDFSPALGIPEDPATGTATGALAALLLRHGMVEAGRNYRFEQGYEIGRPSVIYARVEENVPGGLAVYVKGTAVRSLIGELQLSQG